jgi:hypothetical protein
LCCAHSRWVLYIPHSSRVVVVAGLEQVRKENAVWEHFGGDKKHGSCCQGNKQISQKETVEVLFPPLLSSCLCLLLRLVCRRRACAKASNAQKIQKLQNVWENHVGQEEKK